MSYIKNAFLLLFLSYSYSILNSPSKETLKRLIKLKIKKYQNEFESITNFVNYCLDETKSIHKSEIDFQFKKNLDNKYKETFDSIKAIKANSLEKDFEDIISTNRNEIKKGRNKNGK